MNYTVITAKLVARTAVHIGSGEGNDVTDALLRRDAQSWPLIPGTAIGGALRTLATRLAPRLDFGYCAVLADNKEDRQKSCSCAVCHLFGDVNPSDREGMESEKKTASAASRLLVFNAAPIGILPRVFIRDGVGIDRVTGAAARAGSVKFDLEALPAGTEFQLRMELRDASPQDEQLLAAVLSEWQAGRVWLGGRVARGLGAFCLVNLEYRTHALDTAAGLLAFLKQDEPWTMARLQPDWLEGRLATIQIKPPDPPKPFIAQRWVTVEGVLQAEGPLLTHDASSSGRSGFDHAPLLAQWGDWQSPVLTGAGLRGVLRSHAERLARTLATLQAAGKDDFLRRCPACDPNARNNDKQKPLSLESCDSLLKKADVSGEMEAGEDSLCLACRLFGSARRGSRLIVEDAPYYPTATQSKPVLKMLDFLAIDRFTGGGADGFKFDALALWRSAFTLRLHLDNPEPWELGWLALVLRDLAEGWLSAGFGAAKGFGRVQLTDWSMKFGYLDKTDSLGLAQLGNGLKDGLYTWVEIAGQSGTWLNLAESWVQQFVAKVQAFERSESIQLRQDSYFGQPAEKLYCKEVPL